MKFLVEILQRIKAISVVVEADAEIVSFRVFQESKTQLKFVINDEKLITTIELPQEPVLVPNETLNKLVKIDKSKNKCVLFVRLPLEAQHIPSEVGVKWGKNEFKSSIGSIKCLKCNQMILTDVEHINELPSEHWHELLDYWHCHKPLDNKLYDLSKFSLKPLPNSILISSSYILTNSSTACACHSIDAASQLTKIMKWNISLNNQLFSTNQYIYNLILENVVELAVRYLIFSYGEKGHQLLIWVVNTGVEFKTKNFSSENAIKLFYTSATDQIEKEKSVKDVETVELDENVWNGLISLLESVNKDIPAGGIDKFKSSFLFV